MTYDPKEQDEVLETFTEMLRAVTADGGRKREKGDKVPWTVDPGHEKGLFSHLYKWKAGELVDPDSGAHPLVHAAWRALAIAWQERRMEEYLVEKRREWYTFPLFEEGGVQQVSTPTAPFKHKPCQRCQTQGLESAGHDPALD